MVDDIRPRNFYLLQAIDFDNGIDGHPFWRWYDCVNSVVVLATNEGAARGYAAGVAGEEGMGAWLNPDYTTCEIITTDTVKLGVVIYDRRDA